jgi:prepilin-type N-terminal cleavage/methylation domain-containing protein
MNNAYVANRPGVTLIEVVMTISIGAVVLGVTVTLFASILRGDRTARQHLTQTQTIGRLTRQFRQDARAADSVELIASPNATATGLRFASADGLQVDYEWVEDSVRRTRSATGKPAAHELFGLRSTRAAFRVDTSDDRSFAILPLQPAPLDSGGSSLELEARVGPKGSSAPSPSR